MVPAISDGIALRWSWEWVPSLGIALSFLVDGLSLTFALLITGIGALVFLYASKYLQGHPHFARFMLFLVMFMLAMLGLVLSDNLLTLFVFWELTTITSYLLIGFDHATAKGRRSALQALLLTGTGGLALLAGFILIGHGGGHVRIVRDPRAGRRADRKRAVPADPDPCPCRDASRNRRSSRFISGCRTRWRPRRRYRPICIRPPW